MKKTDHSAIAFGYEARDMYVSLNDAEQLQYLYFSTFKMTLHNKEGAKREKVKAVNCDEEISVVKLLAACMKLIKEKAMKELSTSTTVPIQCHMIQWIVTVPAIWVRKI